MESRLTRRILTALRQRGAFAYKVHGNVFQGAGLPDIIACYRGHFVGLEVKLPKGEASPLQLHTIGEIRRAGGTALVVYSVDEAMKILEGIDGNKGRDSMAD